MVEFACDGLAGVAASQVEMSSGLQFFDGIQSAQIQEIQSSLHPISLN